MKFETRIAQLGVGRDVSGSISTPIYQSATFRHPALGESTGYDYSRSGNPTRQALEEGIADLEGGCRGFAFASGMAALTALLMLFKPGDHLIATDDLYGGTYRLFQQVFLNYDITVDYVDTSNINKLAQAIKKNTKAIFIETPTNPTMKITDIKKVVEMVASKDILTIVDNTFLTPYLQRPLELGADLVIHSASKYLGGHNDLIAGLIVAKDEDLAEKIYFTQNATGGILGPQDSWLLIRGMKTLSLRMERHEATAHSLASWLKSQSWVERVYYPGLESHPGHSLNKKQSRGSGGMISFTVSREVLVEKIINCVKLISFAESLGGVESLITFPAKQTHGDIEPEIRERLGITDSLLRLSVGIEDGNDLINDLKQAVGKGW